MNPFVQIAEDLELFKGQWEAQMGSGASLSNMLALELKTLEGVSVPSGLLEGVQDFIRIAKKASKDLAAFGAEVPPTGGKLFEAIYGLEKDSLINQARALKIAWG